MNADNSSLDQRENLMCTPLNKGLDLSAKDGYLRQIWQNITHFSLFYIAKAILFSSVEEMKSMFSLRITLIVLG